jgi:pyruvate dehydrogenase E2 component (dihydrolipoyllysine-residue acetyltransferase)
MATEIVLPQWSMGMTDGTIVRWLKQEGESVAQGEPLVEVEAAKVTSEVEAEVSGVLARILVAEGETVPVRAPLCLIGTVDEVVASVENSAAPVESVSVASTPAHLMTPSPSPIPVTPVARKMAQEHGIDLGQVRGSGPRGRIVIEDVQRAVDEATRSDSQPPMPTTVQVIPAARRLAKVSGIDLDRVRGSGPEGRVTVEDVQRVIDATAQPEGEPTQQAQSDEQLLPLTGMRGAIARRMHQSVQTSAQVTLTTETDVSSLVRLREKLKQQFALTYTDLVVEAAASALKAHPRLNAWIEGEHIRLAQGVHIGVAVALDDGLIVPVVRDADRKSLQQIAQETQRLAICAREGSLARDEVIGGTFSVTNLGMYGVDAFTPIINPPEVAILGVGRISEKLVRVPQGAEWRHVMTLSLTFDHRAIDGAPAAAFLQTIGKYLERSRRKR